MRAVQRAKGKPFRWSVPIAWLITVTGGLQVGLGAFWHDGLNEAGGVMLALHYLAFMCQTFMFHAGLAAGFALLVGLAFRRSALVAASFVVLAMGALPECVSLVPLGTSAKDSGPTLRIMSVNLMYGMGDQRALVEQLQSASPDVILFQEWTPEGARAIRPLLEGSFPHSVEQTRDDAFGQAVFSKREFTTPPRDFPPIAGFAEPQITFGVLLDGRAVSITNVHLLPPIGRAYFRMQRAGAARYAAWGQEQNGILAPDVLMGDFNAVPRSSLLKAIRASGFRDAHADSGWGRGSTWPQAGVLAWLPGIRLDHALIGERLECVSSHVGEPYGSDHLPILIDVKWKSAESNRR